MRLRSRDQRASAIRLEKISATQSIPSSGAANFVSYDAIPMVRGNDFEADYSTGFIMCKTTGLVLVIFQACWQAAGAADSARQILIKHQHRGATNIRAEDRDVGTAAEGAGKNRNVSMILEVDQNDTIWAEVMQNSGSAINLNTGTILTAAYLGN